MGRGAKGEGRGVLRLMIRPDQTRRDEIGGWGLGGWELGTGGTGG